MCTFSNRQHNDRQPREPLLHLKVAGLQDSHVAHDHRCQTVGRRADGEPTVDQQGLSAVGPM